MNEKTLKIIGQWSRDEAYVYIRPITSKFAFPDKPSRQYWVVTVQIRGMGEDGKPLGTVDYRAEGYDLDEIVSELGTQVPRRPIGASAAGKLKFARPGWLAPENRSKVKVGEKKAKKKKKSKKAKKK